MSTRVRLFLAALLLMVIPATLLAMFFRGRLAESVRNDFHGRWHAAISRQLNAVGTSSLDGQKRLVKLAVAASDDNQLRLALVGGRPDLAGYLRDYAGRQAPIAGLDVLELVDADGRILSSAHYRNEFGTSDAGLRAFLAERSAAGGGESRPLKSTEFRDHHHEGTWFPIDAASSFTVERDPRGRRLAIVNYQPFDLAGRTFAWIGGHYVAMPDAGLAAADTVFNLELRDLSRHPVTQDALDHWGDRLDRAWIAQPVPLVLDGRASPATLVAFARRHDLHRQLRQLDQLVGVLLATILVGAFLLAAVVSRQLSRPLVTLAYRAGQVDVDHPDIDLATDRRDEVGTLSRVLQAMVARLREGARRLAAAEHRATLGEVARQVNHDLRNGITPVRNVVRHLGETAERDPDRLAAVFQERRTTLDSSLSYLEDLAGRYARLAPGARRESCDLAALARAVLAIHPGVDLQVDADAPPVLADPISMRRILDNLVRNAHEALPDGRGRITVTVAAASDPDLGPQCALSVQDDGEGMSPEVQAHVLEDFYTTKPGGSGLGLSNVRRLAGDAGGHLHLDSAPGRGTTVTITFPAAEHDS